MKRQQKPASKLHAPDFDRFVTHIDNSVVVPEVASHPPLVAAWVKNPKEMLQALTAEFDQLLSLVDDDGELKTRHITNSEGIPVRVFKELMILQHREKCVSVANAIQPTPFDSGVILRIRNELSRSSSSRFRKALKNYRTALRQLADWIAAKDLLSGEPNAAVSNGNRIPCDLQTGPIPCDGKKKRTIRFNDPTAKIPERFCVGGKPCGPFIGSITDIIQALRKGKTGRAKQLKKLCDEENAILFVTESGIRDTTLYAYFIKERFNVIAESWPDSFSAEAKANLPGVFKRP